MKVKRPRVLVTASPSQRKKLQAQAQLVRQHQQNAQEAGDVLVALLQMVYAGFDRTKHEYIVDTGQVTVRC